MTAKDKIKRELENFLQREEQIPFEVNQYCARKLKTLIEFAETAEDDDLIGCDETEVKDMGEVSDGYHTFNELYYYRMLYNAAFFNLLPKSIVHKSKRHNDGEECFGKGWFIVMANLPTGQVSNHYELKWWDLFDIPEKEKADLWDGHTPQEAANRIYKFLNEKMYLNLDENKYKTAIENISRIFKDASTYKSLGVIPDKGNMLKNIEKECNAVNK